MNHKKRTKKIHTKDKSNINRASTKISNHNASTKIIIYDEKLYKITCCVDEFMALRKCLNRIFIIVCIMS